MGKDATGAPSTEQQARINQMMRDRGFHVSEEAGATPNVSHHMEVRQDRPLTGPNARPTERQQNVLSMFDQVRNMTTDPTERRELEEAERAYRREGSPWRMSREERQRMLGMFHQLRRRLTNTSVASPGLAAAMSGPVSAPTSPGQAPPQPPPQAPAPQGPPPVFRPASIGSVRGGLYPAPGG